RTSPEWPSIKNVCIGPVARPVAKARGTADRPPKLAFMSDHKNPLLVEAYGVTREARRWRYRRWRRYIRRHAPAPKRGRRHGRPRVSVRENPYLARRSPGGCHETTAAIRALAPPARSSPRAQSGRRTAETPDSSWRT